MLVLNRHADLISGSVNGEIFSRTYDEKVWEELKKIETEINSASNWEDTQKALKKFKDAMQESLEGYIESINPYIYVNRKTGSFHLKYNDVIISDPMPNALVNRIKTSIDKKIDIMPLIKCWVRWLRNHNSSLKKSERFFNFIDIMFTNPDLVEKLITEKGYSEELASQMASCYSMKITNEGLLAGFKVSSEITKRFKLNDKGESEEYNIYETGKKSIDPISGLITYEKISLLNEDRVFEPAVHSNGDDFYCGDKLGYVIKVGQVHRLPDWSFVNTNDAQSCVPGLHIGGLDYIRGYQNDNTCTHNIFVDPMHIGAIPDDSTGAIRCIQYFVCDEFSGVNGSIYHSSSYAKMTDEEWFKELEQLKKERSESVKSIETDMQSDTNEKEALTI